MSDLPMGPEDIRDDDEKDEADRNALLAKVPEVCPACGCDDLHSGSVGGQDAVCCMNCVWSVVLETLRDSVTVSGSGQ